MQVNTRRNQIAKSSIYFLLKKKIKAKPPVLSGVLDLGVIQFSIENQELLLYSSNYPEHQICLLRQVPHSYIWDYNTVEAGQSISYVIYELAKKEFYPELNEKRRNQIIIRVAYEVWRKIDSWAS